MQIHFFISSSSIRQIQNKCLPISSHIQACLSPTLPLPWLTNLKDRLFPIKFPQYFISGNCKGAQIIMFAALKSSQCLCFSLNVCLWGYGRGERVEERIETVKSCRRSLPLGCLSSGRVCIQPFPLCDTPLPFWLPGTRR